jgi:hypothetical protein
MTFSMDNTTGASITPSEYKNIHFKIQVLRDDTKECINDKILKILSINKNTIMSTVTICFRLKDVCRNYRTKFLIQVQPQYTSNNIRFETICSNPIDVRSKRPNKITSTSMNTSTQLILENGELKPQIGIKRKKTRQQPKWLLSWSLSANEHMRKNEWHTFGFRSVNGNIDYTQPIRKCTACDGFESQGHKPKCSLRALLHVFKKDNISTILQNITDDETKKPTKRRRSKNNL